VAKLKSASGARIPGHTSLGVASGVLALLIVASGAVSYAQGPRAGGPPPAAGAAPGAGGAPRAGGAPAVPQTPRSQAPFDLTGNWVSLITLDWRFRMLVPGRGEYTGVPITLASLQFADAWTAGPDEAAGKQCEAYGAGIVMAIPQRLQISWIDDQTLQMKTDAGQQTRLLRFGPAAGGPLPARSWQGDTRAEWLFHRVGRGFGGGGGGGATPPDPNARREGQLKLVTTNMLAGLIRKNGIPYSDQSTTTEYWELNTDPTTQKPYLIVTVALRDPMYLTRDYYYTAQYEKEPDASKWRPTPCTLTGTP